MSDGVSVGSVQLLARINSSVNVASDMIAALPPRPSALSMDNCLLKFSYVVASLAHAGEGAFGAAFLGTAVAPG